ncbi:MAG: fumarylacetoacetate hydrolase family protein [Bacteroidetes bacterium]|nr:fumarylacetoacetate hydrolase family protein [Bacteroidota bacterium]
MMQLQLAGSDRGIRPGKIICLGRNYPAHAKEMNAEVPSEPVLFLKPASALLENKGVVHIPPFSRELHHEVEMVLLVGRDGTNIPEEKALQHVLGYAVGLDMTLRDVQAEAKKKGLPWSVAKGFDTSAPISTFVPAERVRDPHALDIRLSVNGTVRQQSNTRHMIFGIKRMIAYISSVFTLEQGDLIFTGTPDGVGPAKPGDILLAELEDVGSLTVSVSRHD